MTVRINMNKMKSLVVLGLLYFATMNFRAKFFYFVFASLITLVFIQRKVLLKPATMVYLALCVLMSLYNNDEGIMSMIRCFAFVGMYVTGYNMIVEGLLYGKTSEVAANNTAQKKAMAVLTVISAGSYTHYILNYLNNSKGYISRNTYDIWSGSIMAATGQATLACLMLGLSVAMVFMPEKKRYRYLGILFIVIALAYNLVLAGRTTIVIVCILFIVGVLYFRKAVENSYEKIKVALGFVFVIACGIILLVYDVGGIQEFVLNSNFFQRFKLSLTVFASSSGRANSKLAFLTDAWKYPFGGLHLREQHGYAHDLLLDGYDEYGLLGFLLLLLILVMGLKALYQWLKYARYDNTCKLAFLLVYCSILLVFMVEPILAGMPWLFSCFCLLNGCVDGMLTVERRRRTI